MTTSIMARRHTAAGPNPEEHTRVIDNRTFERLLAGVKHGTVVLDTTDYRYRNIGNNTDMDDAMWEAETNGWVTLAVGKPPALAAAGEKWLADRYAEFGPSTSRPVFLAPGVPTPGYEKRCGERINTARLTVGQVRDIKGLMQTGSGNADLAREYGVDESTIRRIRTGDSWRHVA